MNNQLRFNFYANRAEFIRAFIEQLLHTAPNFRAKRPLK